jgi:hypothetical protein
MKDVENTKYTLPVDIIVNGDLFASVYGRNAPMCFVSKTFITLGKDLTIKQLQDRYPDYRMLDHKSDEFKARFGQTVLYTDAVTK